MSERTKQANEIIERYTYWAAGFGFIPIPLADIAAVTGTQVRLVSELAKIYEIQFSSERVRAIIGSLLGGVLPVAISGGSIGSAVKAVPVIGSIVGFALVPALAAATTQAVGRVYLHHFEAGGTLLDFDPDKLRSHFEEEFKASRAKQSGGDAETKAKQEPRAAKSKAAAA